MDVDTDTTCDEYVDGSIYRVKLHNFLTYSDAEFYPGPRLNLVLGPNGTGKSSIVCALCIGLAGNAKLLGRADKVGQFVRHEHTSGYTEIELYFTSGNQVIKRHIYRDNRSDWQLNGKDSTLNQITTILRAAKIQIDNLCQFLPQDKVGEFSRMNPVQLLRATEEAVWDGDLATQHTQLIDIQREMGDKERQLETAIAALELMKAENAQREKEVERIVDYEARIKETELMRKKILWLEFEAKKNEVEELKNDKRKCQDALQKANDKDIKPLQGRLNNEKSVLEKKCERKGTSDTQLRSLEGKLKKIKDIADAIDATIQETEGELHGLRSHHESMERKLQRIQSEVELWTNERKELPNEDQLKQEKSDLENTHRQKELERAEIASQLEARSRYLHQLSEKRRHIVQRLNKLDDAVTQRRIALERLDKDALQAADWVQNNSSIFKRRVWGPVILEMQVSDALHAKYLEDTLAKWILSAFVTECKEDYDLLIKELKNAGGGRALKVAVVNVEGGQCNNLQRPFTNDQFNMFRQQFGFSGYLDELVRAPDIIQEVLRSHGGTHMVLIGTHKTEEIVNSGKDIFSRVADSDKRIAFVTPVKKYVTSVSKYGNHNVTTRTNDLKNPRYLGVSTSNETEKSNMLSDLENIDRETNKIKDDIAGLQEKDRSLTNSNVGYIHRISDIRSHLKVRMRLDDKIREGNKRIAALKHEIAQDVSGKENKLKQKLKECSVNQAKLPADFVRCLNDLAKESATNTSLALECATQSVVVDCVHQHLELAERTIRDLQEAYSISKETLRTAAKQAMDLKRAAEQAAPWNEHEQAFARLSDDLNELRATMQSNEVELECFRGDISIRHLFEQTCREILKEEKAVEALRGSITQRDSDVQSLKDSWIEKLKSMIQKIDTSFKTFFQEIGCVGEVILDDSSPDVSKWGIQRRAQFRKNTKLSTLTAEEQSGGEKSVGTIMYLMALQSLTRCPFRVVDEINQGMDVYNERKVFQRITKSSCGGKLSQYFLITPKLITGLKYHADTKVLIILNGPFNKLLQEQWNIPRIVKRPRSNSNVQDHSSTMNNSKARSQKKSRDE